MSIQGPLPPPNEPPSILPGEPPPFQNLTLPLDTLEQLDNSLQLFASNHAIALPPGRLSLLELTTLINQEIKNLRSAILRAENLDPELWRRAHQAAIDAALELEKLHAQLQEKIRQWRVLVLDSTELVFIDYPNLVTTYNSFNLFMNNTWQSDRTAIQDLNALYLDYNTLTPGRIQQIYNSLTPQQRADLIAGMTQAEIDALGGEQNAVVIQWFNAQITSFNNYASNRDVQEQIDTLLLATLAYNAKVDAINLAIAQVNAERATFNLPPLPPYPRAPTPSPDPLYPVLPQQPLITTPIPPTLSELREFLTVPGIGDKGLVAVPPSPGLPLIIQSADLFVNFFTPVLNIALSIIEVSNRLIELSAEWALYDAVTANTPGIKNFVAPYGLFQKVGQVPIADLSGGGGAGLISFSLGLHSRILERVLSHALLQTIAQGTSFPVSQQFFESLQFSVLELLSKSSLLSAAPTIRSLSARLGNIGADSPVIAVAIALTFGDQIAALTNSSIIRELVNGQVSGLSFYARVQQREALAGVAQGEAALQEALNNGNPALIEGAVAHLAKARTALAETTRLFNAFGGASFGELAASANGLSAALNLSLLSVSTALYARALGIPELAPALFAQTHGEAANAALAALGSGSSIIDILDNPINMVYIKQTLVNQLINKFGVDAPAAQALVSGSINGTILKGADIHTLGGLQEVLLSEFLGHGAGLLQANALANEVTALIRGDLGNLFLHAAFGIHFDSSLIAASTANALFGKDVGLAGEILSNAIVHSLLYGGFGTQVRLQNELSELFQALGTSRSDAQEIASQTRQFIEMIGLAIPLNRYPGIADVLTSDTMLKKIAFGEGIVRQELVEDLQIRGLTNTQAEFLADQLSNLIEGKFVSPSQSDLLELAVREGIERTLIQKDSFETQRDFRDKLAEELRDVGFSIQNALFLSNSVASYGRGGEIPSIYGVSAEQLAVMHLSLAQQISSVTKISSEQAEALVLEAHKKAYTKAPFASEDDFRNILREEIYHALLKEGHPDGQMIFDQAMARLVDPSRLSLGTLIDAINARALALLTPDLGAKLAEEFKDRIFVSLLGKPPLAEIHNEEKREPLSILNQVETQLKHLIKEEEVENLANMLKKLKQLLEALTTPNAQLGFLLKTLTDNPGTFFNAANVSVGSDNFQATQIVA